MSKYNYFNVKHFYESSLKFTVVKTHDRTNHRFIQMEMNEDRGGDK